MTAPGLRIEGLRFTYPALEGSAEPAPLFEGLSVRLDDGARGVVLGGADQGKTTLSRIIAGLVPRFSGGRLEGELEAAGRDARGALPCQMLETIGVLFQDPDEQLFTTRCDTETAFALESLGVPRGEMLRRVAASLELVGLEGFAARNPATLSGGEKKRLLIACLAAVDPLVWVLDEVFQELDDHWKAVLVRLLRETGRTALFLDSRWSPLYAEGFSFAGVLREGRVVPAGGDRGIDTALLDREGLRLADSAGAPGASGASGAGGAARRAGGSGELLLRLDGIRFHFPGTGSFGLSIDQLELRSGEVCALVGRNGSGKSTLARLLCGLASPGSGTILVRDGRALRPASTRDLNCRVGYMFQNPDYQIFLPTVSEELGLGLRAAGTPEASVEDKVREAIHLFGLPHGETPPALMSYGARKRLQAATYFLLGRDLFILDEIDSGLSYREVLPLIDALASSGAGLLLITHDALLARAAAGRVITIEDGRIVQDSAVQGAG
jgi:energy-coupling factor transport system ATP-binding protein